MKNYFICLSLIYSHCISLDLSAFHPVDDLKVNTERLMICNKEIDRLTTNAFNELDTIEMDLLEKLRQNKARLEERIREFLLLCPETLKPEITEAYKLLEYALDESLSPTKNPSFVDSYQKWANVHFSKVKENWPNR